MYPPKQHVFLQFLVEIKAFNFSKRALHLSTAHIVKKSPADTKNVDDIQADNDSDDEEDSAIDQETEEGTTAIQHLYNYLTETAAVYFLYIQNLYKLYKI